MSKLLEPSSYKKNVWANGRGVMYDIARLDEKKEVWRFARTPIDKSGPFSDYTGYDRCQVLIEGRGLTLETPNGSIDVRHPFEPVRFAGETPIASRLVKGPVQVVNLIGKRSVVRIDLRVLQDGQGISLHPGIHFAYCAPGDTAEIVCDGKARTIPGDHTFSTDVPRRVMLNLQAGRVIVGSVMKV